MLDINNIPSIPNELEDYIENGFDIPMTDEEYQAWVDEDISDALIELEYTSDILDSIDGDDFQTDIESIDLI